MTTGLLRRKHSKTQNYTSLWLCSFSTVLSKMQRLSRLTPQPVYRLTCRMPSIFAALNTPVGSHSASLPNPPFDYIISKLILTVTQLADQVAVVSNADRVFHSNMHIIKSTSLRQAARCVPRICRCLAFGDERAVFVKCASALALGLCN